MPYFPPPGSGGGGSGEPAVDQTARNSAAAALSSANAAKRTADDAVAAAGSASALASSAYQVPATGIGTDDLSDGIKTLLTQAGTAVQPAGLTKAAVGLGNVDNTADASKPVSAAQTTALNLRVPNSRSVTTGSGLTGGGTLAADRELSLTAAVLTSLAKADSAFQKDSSGILLADLSPAVVTSLGKADTAVQPAGLTKTALGLANVDNTSDANKPVSTATQTALNAKAPTTRTVTAGTGLTGGGDLSVDRTVALSAGTISSLGKADTAVQPAALTTALSSKADLVGGVIPTSQLPAIAITDVFPVTSQAQMLALTAQRGDVAVRSDVLATYILAADDPTVLANWTVLPVPAGGNLVQSVNGQTGTVVLGKADVGLGSVDNTSDANKPVSSATQTALNLKAPLASPAFTGTVTGVTATMVGLGNVNNTADSAKPVSTAQQSALDLKAPLASPTFTGTVSGVTKAMVGLGSVDNTADTAKPVSTAQQTALNLKAPLASPTFTGTVSGVTAAMVGLGNVSNTSDANKPVSTAQQTALNGKVGTDGTALNIVKITQAAYSALTTPVATTVYLIVG